MTAYNNHPSETSHLSAGSADFALFLPSRPAGLEEAFPAWADYYFDNSKQGASGAFTHPQHSGTAIMGLALAADALNAHTITAPASDQEVASNQIEKAFSNPLTYYGRLHKEAERALKHLTPRGRDLLRLGAGIVGLTHGIGELTDKNLRSKSPVSKKSVALRKGKLLPDGTGTEYLYRVPVRPREAIDLSSDGGQSVSHKAKALWIGTVVNGEEISARTEVAAIADNGNILNVSLTAKQGGVGSPPPPSASAQESEATCVELRVEAFYRTHLAATALVGGLSVNISNAISALNRLLYDKDHTRMATPIGARILVPPPYPFED